MATQKICCDCGETKDIKEFTVINRRYHMKRCKMCFRIYRKKYPPRYIKIGHKRSYLEINGDVRAKCEELLATMKNPNRVAKELKLSPQVVYSAIKKGILKTSGGFNDEQK